MNLQDIMEKEKQERLERTEASLKLAGAVKCEVCKVWVDSCFIEAGKCNNCIIKGENG